MTAHAQRPAVRPASRLSSPQGLTLVEMAVVLVLIGLLLAVTLPRFVGTEESADGQKAQTTASGALDTAVQVYTTVGVRDGTGCAGQAASPRTQMDPGPYPVADPSTDPSSWTSCPVFANPADLAMANGDVRFVAGDQASSADTVASVAAAQTPDGWRAAVAVLAPAKHSAADADEPRCWMAWHQFPAADGGSSAGEFASIERYFTYDHLTDAAVCTANAALVQQTSTVCDTPAASGGSGEPLGLSWRRPCPTRTTP